MNKAIGWILVVVGVVQMVSAAFMNVTLLSDPSIANNDLMAQRSMVFNGGGFAFLGGCIALAAERVRSAFRVDRAPD